jgi:hypothetical protein
VKSLLQLLWFTSLRYTFHCTASHNRSNHISLGSSVFIVTKRSLANSLHVLGRFTVFRIVGGRFWTTLRTDGRELSDVSTENSHAYSLSF